MLGFFCLFFGDSINIICTSQGINPHITYSFEESEDFVIINGFLFLVNDLTDDTFRLTVRLKKIEHHKAGIYHLSNSIFGFLGCGKRHIQ